MWHSLIWCADLFYDWTLFGRALTQAPYRMRFSPFLCPACKTWRPYINISHWYHLPEKSRGLSWYTSKSKPWSFWWFWWTLSSESWHKLWLYSWWFCCLKLQIWCFIFRLYWVSEIKLAYWIHANKNFCQVCFGLQESCNSILGPSVKFFRQICTFHSLTLYYLD